METVWRCPDCETINSGNKCIICGKNRPEVIDNDQPAVLYKQKENQRSDQGQSVLKDIPKKSTLAHESKNNKSYTYPEIQRKRENKIINLVIILIVTVMALLIAAVILLVGFVNDNREQSAETESVTVTATVNETELITDETINMSLTEQVTEVTTAPNTTTSVTSTPEITSAKMLEVPYLLYKDLSSAASELNQLGIKYKVVYEDDDRVDKDCIFKQSKKSGTMISENTVLTIYVSLHGKITTTVTTTTTAKTTPKTSNDVTASLASDKNWNETKISETMYVVQACYSRKKPVVGAEVVSLYRKGDAVKVVAATDTSYYKLDNGAFIFADYLAYEVTETMTASASNNGSSVRLSQTSMELTKGYSTVLSVSNCDADDVVWTSGNEDVVTVGKWGKIVGVGVGTTYIYASVNGNIDKCKVTVVAGKITASPTNVDLTVGESTTVLINVKGDHVISVDSSDKTKIRATWNGAKFKGDYIYLTIKKVSAGDGYVKVYLKNYPNVFAVINVNGSKQSDTASVRQIEHDN